MVGLDIVVAWSIEREMIDVDKCPRGTSATFTDEEMLGDSTH